MTIFELRVLEIKYEIILLATVGIDTNNFDLKC